MEITIATCFYNSERHLERYMRGLMALDRDGVSLNVVLVDNASTDATLSKLERLARSMTVPVTLLSENRPGLMYARCAAAEAATGRFVVFFDDDNVPLPNYLMEIRSLVQRYPDAVVLTGNAVLPDEYDLPNDVRPAASFMAVRDVKGERTFELDHFTPHPFPWGAGLAVERERLLEGCRYWLRGDQAIVGRTRTAPLGGEEIWLMHRVTVTGGRVVFSDRLRLVHWVARERFEPNYLLQLAYAVGSAVPRIFAEVAKFKPNVKSPYRWPLIGMAVGLLWLLLYVAKFCRRPTTANMALVVAQLGVIQSLAAQRRVGTT